MTIALYDDFDNPLGKFVNYDMFDQTEKAALAAQEHTDIRSFVQDDLVTPYSMYSMDNLLNSFLDTLTMGDLESAEVIFAGEHWTSPAVVGPQSDRNNWAGLNLPCNPGSTTTASIMAPLDISAYSVGDSISLSLPAFPLADLDLANSSIDFTSSPTGDFSLGPTDSLAFSTSVATLISGDCEASFPVTQFINCDLAAITGVRFTIEATNSCAFRCLAIRCLGATWSHAAFDSNTEYARLVFSPPPGGNLLDPVMLPFGTPIVFFSDGGVGPTMVDLDVGYVLHTGSNLAQNMFTLYFRETPFVPNFMSTLDALTMATLDALPIQPAGSVGTFDDRTQSEYVAVSLQWGTDNTVTFMNDLGRSYVWPALGLAADTDYYVHIVLQDRSLRMKIHPVSLIGVVDWATVVFDSLLVNDWVMIQRRPGRLGWFASLQEGDTYIRSLRPRSLIYKEYRSVPLQSDTPVEGARIFPSATADKNLYTGATARPGTTVTLDTSKSRSGHCLRVNCSGTNRLEGIITNVMQLENLFESEVSFDVLLNSPIGLSALLQGDPTVAGEARLIELYVPPIALNVWVHVTIPLEQVAEQFSPGPYNLQLLQSDSIQAVWYLDNIKVLTRAVSWAGRGQAADAWQMTDPPFIKFGDAINDPYAGALLGRGNQFQIRGQALTQDATIDNIKILPRYAELGNFVWADQAPIYGVGPDATISSTTSGNTVTYTAAPLHSGSNLIIDYCWLFDDGTYAYGTQVSHTYATSGDHPVNLIVIDELGLKTSVTDTVTIPRYLSASLPTSGSL